MYSRLWVGASYVREPDSSAGSIAAHGRCANSWRREAAVAALWSLAHHLSPGGPSLPRARRRVHLARHEASESLSSLLDVEFSDELRKGELGAGLHIAAAADVLQSH